MSQSLVDREGDAPPPMQRSASFHYENVRMRGASADHHEAGNGNNSCLRTLTSEDESTEDYGSGCDSSNVSSAALIVVCCWGIGKYWDNSIKHCF